jgi:hypothetical protein
MTEYASHRRSGSFHALTQTLAQAPPEIVRSINAKRRAAGLIEVPTRGNPKAKLTPRRPTTTISMPRIRHYSPATAAKWAGLQLSATIACGRLRQNLKS